MSNVEATAATDMKRLQWLHFYRAMVLLSSIIGAGGCSLVAARTTQSFADGLSTAIADDDDPQTVADALPSYILMLEGMLIHDPDNAETLAAAAKLYLAYATQFVEDPVRIQTLSDRAFAYAQRSACLRVAQLCGVQAMSYQTLTAWLPRADTRQVASLYLLSTAWGQWINSRKDDWNAIAQLAQVKAIMQRIVELDEGYDHGEVHVYLGIMDSLVPAAMGGKPEIAQRHFERAIELSGQKNLYAKVAYAEHYARLVFDRELHDRLLREVLASKTQADGLTLINVIAQRKARLLLESADAYF